MSDLTPESFFRLNRTREETGAIVGKCEILEIECRLRFSQGSTSGDCRTCVFAQDYLQRGNKNVRVHQKVLYGPK